MQVQNIGTQTTWEPKHCENGKGDGSQVVESGVTCGSLTYSCLLGGGSASSPSCPSDENLSPVESTDERAYQSYFDGLFRVKELEAQLCTIQYMNQLNILSAKAICKAQEDNLKRQHWLNTRGIVDSMRRAAAHSERRNRRSQSGPALQRVQRQSFEAVQRQSSDAVSQQEATRSDSGSPLRNFTHNR